MLNLMNENKQEYSSLLWEILDKAKVSTEQDTMIELNKLLTPTQKHDLALELLNKLPKSNFEYILDFHDKFKVPKEETHIVKDFKYAKLRFNLILEEVLELGKALGFDNHDLYMLMITQYNKIKVSSVEVSTKEIADALTDILFVTFGGFDVFNFKPVQYKLLKEVYRSNMSKLIHVENDYQNTIKLSVAHYKAVGIAVTSEDLNNGYIAIKNRETGKILKPVTYSKPDLETIINTLKEE
jgi:predicted HAD superfamily Cof-like phosphohydrolase